MALGRVTTEVGNTVAAKALDGVAAVVAADVGNDCDEGALEGVLGKRVNILGVDCNSKSLSMFPVLDWVLD